MEQEVEPVEEAYFPALQIVQLSALAATREAIAGSEAKKGLGRGLVK